MTGVRLFLSYRRDDSAGHAGRLADHLLDRFGAGTVFMDVESIEAGADFTQAIERAIDDSDAVLVLIGPGWLDAAAHQGRRRLDDPADFVRREIEAALRSDTRVIPVLVGGAMMPAEDRLPDPIAELARRNAVELLDRRWREDVDALVDVLEGRGKAVMGNLPVQPTPFLGRTRELAEVIELLRRDDVRLLTLTGPGGTGKTRLAIQSASKLAHTYPGGAWFVGLAPLTDPDLVLAEVGAVLEVQGGGDGSLVEALAARVSRARTLVVLDNLEQLLPDAAGPVSELSAAAPSLDLVVSSREPLHVAAEREYPVDTLPEEEATALFVERARAVRPGFEPRDDIERRTIAQICERLDRLPLAIELAAARIKLLPPAKLLERLEQRLPLLAGGARDAPARQQTLRATIGWSYDLLFDDERQLFERLAVFSSGCTLEAAEAVARADLDTLQSLVERNLVREQDGPYGEPRYLMLETIREFALERLEARSDVEDLRRVHAEYFLAMAADAEPHLRGPDQGEWIDRLDAEHDNYRATLRWALDGPDPERGLELVTRLAFAWFARRPFSEAHRWASEALARTPAAASAVRARVLTAAGFFAEERSEKAIALIEEGVRCAREAGDVAAEAYATANLSGQLPAERSDERIPLGLEAVRLARASGERWVLMIALNNLGEFHRAAGDAEAATVAYEEALQIGREMGDTSIVALLVSNLAEMALVADELPRARALSTEALELATAIGSKWGTPQARAVCGWVALAERRIDEAAEHLRASLVILRDFSQPWLSVTVLLGMAGVAAASGDVARAARLEAVAARFEEEITELATPVASGIHLRYLDELRAGTDPSVWEAAAREGAMMSLDEGIDYALSS